MMKMKMEKTVKNHPVFDTHPRDRNKGEDRPHPIFENIQEIRSGMRMKEPMATTEQRMVTMEQKTVTMVKKEEIPLKHRL